MQALYEKVARWSNEQPSTVGRSSYTNILQAIIFHEQEKFGQFVPAAVGHAEFLRRMEAWINSAAAESDQKLLMKLVLELCFLAREDFQALFRAAYRCNAVEWLLSECSIDRLATTAEQSLNQEVEKTWFCPITDFNISEFYHLNHLSCGNRPDWRSLVQLNHAGALKMMHDLKRVRVALVEDFIGSGSQMADIEPLVDYFLAAGAHVAIIPIVVCPRGAILGRQWAAQKQHLTFSPVLELNQFGMINDNSLPVDLDTFYTDVRDAIRRLHPQTGEPGMSPFGYRQTGSLVVMHTNCPDNTPPIFWSPSANWAALFPRVLRGS